MKPIISKLLTSIFLVSSFSAFAQQDVKVTSPKPATAITEENRVIAEKDMAKSRQKMEAARVQLGADRAQLNALGTTLRPVEGFYFPGADKQIDPKDLKSKEISTEVAASKVQDIYIENNNRTIEIKTWEQPKVKIVTTIYYEGEGTKVSDEEWFEKLNISLRSAASSIKIKSGTVGGGSYTIAGGSYAWSSGSGNNTAVFNADGKNIGSQSKLKRQVTIYVPKDNKVDLETKYAEVLISGNLNKLNVDITNGGLEMQDVANLTLRSKYANINTGNIKYGEVELINGRLIMKDANELDLDTKYATVEAAMVKKITLRSTNDEYEIEEVGSLQGRKNYGNLRITKLHNSFELDGTNADVKVRNITASLESIKINNKYADIRLPMREVKNYSVTYLGAYSTVYAGFEKKPVIVEKEALTKSGNAKEDGLADNLRSINRSLARSTGDGDSDGHFTATVGDGKGAKLDLKCQNCTVDFK
jgi:hypothetical protein